MTDVPLYPLFVRLEGRRVAVVGGGSVATRRVERLLECGARVILISPDVTAGLQRLADDGGIEWRREAWSGDVPEELLLCIAATSDPQVNARISRACREAGVLVSDVTDPLSADAIVPAAVRRGDLSIAVATGGSSPALAALVREHVEESIGPEFALLARILRDLRQRIGDQKTQGERADLYRSIASRETLRMLRSGDAGPARRHIREVAGSAGFILGEGW